MAMPSGDVEAAALLEVLQALEVELHHPGVACTRERLEQLLHPQFHEVGRSGRKYDRDTVVAFLATHPRLPAVESHGFAVEWLSRGAGTAQLPVRAGSSCRRRGVGDVAHVAVAAGRRAVAVALPPGHSCS